MPLISDSGEVEEIYQEVAEKGAALPCYCAENQRTVEAILRSVYEYGREIGVDDLPIILGFTVNYRPRSQMKIYTDVPDYLLGAWALIDDVKLLVSEASPYRKLRVMLHLDHGQPDADAELLEEEIWLKNLSTVMYDCSALSLEENIRRTSQYVERIKGKILVEGIVDEIFESGSGSSKNELTSAKDAERYLRQTGVFLMVVNLGTEHRAVTTELKYQARRAKKISSHVGKRLCLHGTSCLKKGELAKVKEDGIIKVNIWTGMEKEGAAWVARFVIKELGNILEAKEIQKLFKEGYLGNKFKDEAYLKDICGGKWSPNLKVFPEIVRKQEWIKGVSKKIISELKELGYDNFRRKR